MIGNKEALEMISLIDPIGRLIFDLVDAEDNPISMHSMFENAKNKLFLSNNEIKYALVDLLLNQLLMLDLGFNLSVRK